MIKYKHLYAWDTMMGSTDYWKETNQRYAEEDSAPIDAIYWIKDYSTTDYTQQDKRNWRIFSEVTNDSTKAMINRILDTMKNIEESNESV